jgi:hypothetical protein
MNLNVFRVYSVNIFIPEHVVNGSLNYYALASLLQNLEVIKLN